MDHAIAASEMVPIAADDVDPLGLISLQKTQGDTISVYKYFQGGCEEKSQPLFSGVSMVTNCNTGGSVWTP